MEFTRYPGIVIIVVVVVIEEEEEKDDQQQPMETTVLSLSQLQSIITETPFFFSIVKIRNFLGL